VFDQTDSVGLKYMFSTMTAHGYAWDLLWEACLDEANGDVAGAFEIAREGVTPRERISINSALKKFGYLERL